MLRNTDSIAALTSGKGARHALSSPGARLLTAGGRRRCSGAALGLGLGLSLGLALLASGPAMATGIDALPPSPSFVDPQVEALPDRLLFDATPVDTLSAPQLVTLSNAGIAALTLSAMSLPIAYVRTGGNCADTVEPGSTCTIAISFRPRFPGTIDGGLVITSNAGSRSVMLRGTATAPSPVLATASARLGLGE